MALTRAVSRFAAAVILGGAVAGTAQSQSGPYALDYR